MNANRTLLRGGSKTNSGALLPAGGAGRYWSITAATTGAAARDLEKAAGLQEGWNGMAETTGRRGVAGDGHDTVAGRP